MAHATSPMNVTQKIINDHLAEGTLTPGSPIGLMFDQTLCQDATGTLVMLALEAMDLDRAKTQASVQYVDHNLIQEDHKNADDHLFLLSAAQRFGLWYSRPGNGISHPLHMQNFCKPGATLIGSDSHTCAAGCMGMFAIGAGGADVALAIAGQPVQINMPEVWGVKLSGELPEWVSAKDVILEMLRRYDVDGGVGRAIEYYGPGLASLSAMDRHVIANMGAELGATATVFPADDEIKRYLTSESRAGDWQPLVADEGCSYDHHSEINLSELEPLIARPSSPGKVVPVREVAGTPMYQAYIGSSANPGYRDFAMVAEIVKGRRLPDDVSLDINPTSRKTLQMLADSGYLSDLISAGARLHQAGCNGCIGMGQAPATEQNSLRTTPRNFPGRSGTREDKVWLCSPETAAASALNGAITDPRELPQTHKLHYPKLTPASEPKGFKTELLAPKPASVEREPLVKGPNVAALPELEALPESLSVPVLLKVGDDISTDEIMPAGAEVLPFRSNIPKIAEFTYKVVDENYVSRARDLKVADGHAIVGGDNYGQGSSREHAALAPRFLGLRVVLAKSFARIHQQNLINYGVLPLTFAHPEDYDRLTGELPGSPEGHKAALIRIEDVRNQIQAADHTVQATAILEDGQTLTLELKHHFNPQQVLMLLAGSITNWLKAKT